MEDVTSYPCVSGSAQRRCGRGCGHAGDGLWRRNNVSIAAPHFKHNSSSSCAGLAADSVEVCPQSAAAAEDLAKRVAACGGTHILVHDLSFHLDSIMMPDSMQSRWRSARRAPLRWRTWQSGGSHGMAQKLCRRRANLLHLSCGAGPDAESVEVSPQSAAVAEDLAKRVAASGGAALIIDYGNDAPATDSLRWATVIIYWLTNAYARNVAACCIRQECGRLLQEVCHENAVCAARQVLAQPDCASSWFTPCGCSWKLLCCAAAS